MSPSPVNISSVRGWLTDFRFIFSINNAELPSEGIIQFPCRKTGVETHFRVVMLSYPHAIFRTDVRGCLSVRVEEGAVVAPVDCFAYAEECQNRVAIGNFKSSHARFCARCK